MRILRVVAGAGAVAALVLSLLAARAQPLIIAEVEAPAITCVFEPACTITVHDTVGFIPLPYLVAPNTAFLQSRTFSGAVGTPAAGKSGYIYRISLTQAAGTADCLGGLALNFGPALRLPCKPGQVADVFVVTGGGLGTIGLRSATRFADVIVFDLAKGLCLAGGPNLSNTTFFFGPLDGDPGTDLQRRKPAALQCRRPGAEPLRATARVVRECLQTRSAFAHKRVARRWSDPLPLTSGEGRTEGAALSGKIACASCTPSWRRRYRI